MDKYSFCFHKCHCLSGCVSLLLLLLLLQLSVGTLKRVPVCQRLHTHTFCIILYAKFHLKSAFRQEQQRRVLQKIEVERKFARVCCRCRCRFSCWCDALTCNSVFFFCFYSQAVLTPESGTHTLQHTHTHIEKYRGCWCVLCCRILTSTWTLSSRM